MSKITLTPNASGTGTFTVASPNSNTNRTLTLPDAEGNLVVNTGTGVDITGVLTTDGISTSADITFGDNDKAVFGAGSDLEIFHDGSASRIRDNGTGNLILSATDFQMNNGANNETMMTAVSGGAVTLKYAGSDKIATTSTGINVTGELITTGNVGIGTSSPSAPMTIKSPANAEAIHVVGRSDDIGQIKFLQADHTTILSTLEARNSFVNFGSVANIPLQFMTNNSERMRIDSSGNVGINATTVTPIGSSNPTLQINGTSTSEAGCLRLRSTNGGVDAAFWANSSAAYFGTLSNDPLTFRVNNAEVMRIDSSGNLLVGKTSTNTDVVGQRLASDGYITSTVNNFTTLILNRLNGDGEIANFRKDGSTVGSIGIQSGGFTIDGEANHTGLMFASASVLPRDNSTNTDGTTNLGTSDGRFNDIYATNGTIQTSDRNEKQDIEALSDAEQRVAVACKGLLRKFRWIDAVAEKGDDARIHFGIIAQDLQDAFAAEGLDAGRYAMFISSTWWETQTEVPAVEAVAAVYEDVVIPAVLDEDGNEVEAERIEQQLVTEAVEAKDAYTRTDTYETLEEAPEGATERTRMGVRYPELLAFIIGAM